MTTSGAAFQWLALFHLPLGHILNPVCIIEIGQLKFETKKKSNEFATYLSKIKRNKKSIFLAPCTQSEIRQIILSLKNKKSSGHDCISNLLLKDLVDVLTYPLHIIFNKCLIQGIFPDIMKIADVVPLHKSVSVHILDNYRPVSLLMTISKILEKLVYNHVYAFLDKTDQFYDSQYGFRSKHSCEHAISELVGNILKCVYGSFKGI